MIEKLEKIFFVDLETFGVIQVFYAIINCLTCKKLHSTVTFSLLKKEETNNSLCKF